MNGTKKKKKKIHGANSKGRKQIKNFIHEQNRNNFIEKKMVQKKIPLAHLKCVSMTRGA